MVLPAVAVGPQPAPAGRDARPAVVGTLLRGPGAPRQDAALAAPGFLPAPGRQVAQCGRPALEQCVGKSGRTN